MKNYNVFSMKEKRSPMMIAFESYLFEVNETTFTKIVD